MADTGYSPHSILLSLQGRSEVDNLTAPCIDPSLALECLLDLLSHPIRGHRRDDLDSILDTDDAPHVPHHPLNFAALKVVVDASLEYHPAFLDPSLDLASWDLHIPVQGVRNRPRDVRVIPRQSGQLYFCTFRSLATALTPHLAGLSPRCPGGPTGRL